MKKLNKKDYAVEVSGNFVKLINKKTLKKEVYSKAKFEKLFKFEAEKK